jgi:hypothetical protein
LLASEPSRRRRAAALRACGLCLTVPLGLWVGGYPGAAMLPLLTLGFLWAIASRDNSRLGRAAADPSVIGILLVVAACCDVVGNELWTHGVGGVLLLTLSGVIPELFCLIVAGRLVAALVASGQSGDHGTVVSQQALRSAPEV